MKLYDSVQKCTKVQQNPWYNISYQSIKTAGRDAVAVFLCGQRENQNERAEMY